MKDRIRALVGARRLRRLGPARWIAKYRLTRRYGGRPRDGTVHQLDYIPWDPGLESHSYELDNEGELVAFVHELLGAAASDVAAWIMETKDDPELTTRLARHIGMRLDAKRRQPLGNRVLWYALVRATRPRL